MTADEVRAFTEQHLRHWQALDAAAMAADHAADGVVDSPSAGTHQETEAIRKALQWWIDSFPDMQITKEQVVADTDAAAIVVTIHGTQQGEFFGVPAAGQHLVFRMVLMLRFENGLIAHEQRIYDFSGVLARLGVIKIRSS
ncbi:MAG: ester cyclase [Vicinamibacterales bacterium]|jgi:steroid delta-isomerase-like uncharacterized protein|nr:ester cyclase [Vicinamibacterales bacterium]HJN46298.1 ester cyclase [Vicinamibacterales bacterium]